MQVCRLLPALVASALLIPSFLPAAAGQPESPGRTFTIEVPPIAAVSFLTGTWRGRQGDDHIEETWSEASGGHLQGMFRWMRGDSAPGLMELLSITTEPEGVFLRLRHFDATLTPWASEADGPITLKLAPDQSSPRKAVFRATESEKHLDGVVYDNSAEGALTITITFPKPTGDKPAREPLVLVLQRAPVNAP